MPNFFKSTQVSTTDLAHIYLDAEEVIYNGNTIRAFIDSDEIETEQVGNRDVTAEAQTIDVSGIALNQTIIISGTTYYIIDFYPDIDSGETTIKLSLQRGGA